MLWLKALHIIAMVCWFAGLFYLPRLYVYHAMSTESALKQQFKIMEHKLYYYIMSPAAIATAVFGFWMIYSRYDYYAHLNWLHVKLILVFLLALYHLYLGHLLKAFKQDRAPRSHRFYRWLNEIPTVFLIVIVLITVLNTGS